MQHAAPLKTQMGHVLIVGMQDRIARQDGVAVVAVIVGHVMAVGGGLPDIFGKKIVLRPRRPVCVIFCVAKMQALYLLQKNDVRAKGAQPLAQLVHHHAPVKLREALVDVVGGDVQGWTRHHRT